jgi:hypothetical protein
MTPLAPLRRVLECQDRLKRRAKRGIAENRFVYSALIEER